MQIYLRLYGTRRRVTLYIIGVNLLLAVPRRSRPSSIFSDAVASPSPSLAESKADSSIAAAGKAVEYYTELAVRARSCGRRSAWA